MSPSRQCFECGAGLPEGCRSAVCPACLLGAVPAAVVGIPGTRTPLRVPGHEVLEEIAQGGMGVVYRAREVETQRTVALKVLRPRLADEEGMRERFRLEARAVAALDHPSILPVYRVDEADDLPFFTMKLAAGGTLHARIAGLRGHWREIAGLIADVADAVHYAHQHGVLHRDLKPANVLFDEAGKAWLSDFGLAKLVDTVSDLTASLCFLGTPHYAAPEVAGRSAAAATAASDVWSLGAMLYELLAGQPPFHAEGLPALLRKIVEGAPPALPPEVPRDLAVVCLKCLTKEQPGRYPSAAALAQDLRSWLEGRAIVARPMSSLEKARSWCRHNPALTGMAAVLAAVLVFLAVSIVRESDSNRRALTVSRNAEAAARQAEAAALLAEARARRSAGDFLGRDRAIAAVLRSWQLQPAAAARDELVSLLALPGVAVTGFVVPNSRPGNWTVRPDRALQRYVTLSPAGTSIRRFEDGAEVARLPLRPIRNYPPGPLSPDGRLLVLRRDRTTDVHEVATGRVVLSLPPLRGAASFSDDGRWFLLAPDAGYPGPPRLCDLAATPPQVREVTGLPAGWLTQLLSPDGRFFIAGPPRDEPGLRLLDTVTLAMRTEYRIPDRFTARHMVWRADSKAFVTCSHTGHVACWLPEDPDPAWILPAHDGAAVGAAFFNRDSGLVTIGTDHRTRFWNLTTRQLAGTLPWSGLALHQTPDGSRILADDRDRRQRPLLRCVPPEVCTVTALPPVFVGNAYQAGRPRVLALPDESGFAVSAGFDIHFTDEEGAIIRSLANRRNDALIVDARRFLQRRANRLLIQPFDGSDAVPFAAVGRDALLAFDPRGRTLVAADSEQGFSCWWMAIGDRSPPVALDPVRLGLPAGARVTAMAWSPDGQRFAWSGDRPQTAGEKGGRDRGSWILEMPGGKPVSSPFAGLQVSALGFSGDSRRLIAVTGQELQGAETATGAVVWKIPHQQPSATAVRLAAIPANPLLAVTLGPESISLVDPATGGIGLTLNHPDGRTITALGFNPAGTRLCALAGNFLQTWKLDAIRDQLAQHGMAGRP